MSVDDKYDVCETVYRFAHGVDLRDWALYRSVFADEIRVDYSSHFGFEPAVHTGDAWVAGVVPMFSGLAASQHTMTNGVVELDGDRARCRMYVQARHVLEPDDPASYFTIGGHYDDELVRSDRGPVGWVISSVTLTVTWHAGDPEVMTLARQRGIERQG